MHEHDRAQDVYEVRWVECARRGRGPAAAAADSSYRLLAAALLRPLDCGMLLELRLAATAALLHPLLLRGGCRDAAVAAATAALLCPLHLPGCCRCCSTASPAPPCSCCCLSCPTASPPPPGWTPGCCCSARWGPEGDPTCFSRSKLDAWPQRRGGCAPARGEGGGPGGTWPQMRGRCAQAREGRGHGCVQGGQRHLLIDHQKLHECRQGNLIPDLTQVLPAIDVFWSD